MPGKVKMFHNPRVRLAWRCSGWCPAAGAILGSAVTMGTGHRWAQVVTLEKVGAVASSINATTRHSHTRQTWLLTASASTQYIY